MHPGRRLFTSSLVVFTCSGSVALTTVVVCLEGEVRCVSAVLNLFWWAWPFAFAAPPDVRYLPLRRSDSYDAKKVTELMRALRSTGKVVMMMFLCLPE